MPRDNGVFLKLHLEVTISWTSLHNWTSTVHNNWFARYSPICPNGSEQGSSSGSWLSQELDSTRQERMRCRMRAA
ncbi:hypothetical protein YC2023_087497 [Brassica napus]